MPKLTYNDLTINAHYDGTFDIFLRTLKLHLNSQELAAMIYPLFDEKEKAQAVAPTIEPKP